MDKPDVANSIRALAAALGRSKSAVAKWVRDERWPFGAAPWNVAEVRAWAAATLAPNPAAPDPGPTEPARKGRSVNRDAVSDLSPERSAKLALVVERASMLRQRREIEKGLWHRVDDCRDRRVRQVRELRIRLTSLADSLPFEGEVRDVVRARVMEVARAFAAGPPTIPDAEVTP